MTDRIFDPNAMIAAAREAFAPVFKAQQEGFRAIERLARLQYAFAGDVLDSGLARVHAAFQSSNPTELLNKQTELTTQFVEKLRARAEEWASFTSEVQTKITQLGNEMAAKAVPSKKAA